MAITPTQASVLQALAVAGDDAPAISVYVDLDPSTAPTTPDLAHRTRSTLDAVARQRPDGDHQELLDFDAAAARLEELVAGDALRTGAPVRGLAAFVRGSEVAEAFPLPRSPGDFVHVGRRFALRRLTVELARTGEVLLVEAGRERGTVSLLHDGQLRPVGDDDEELDDQHSRSASTQSKVQRRSDRDAELHLADLAERVERVHARLGRPPLVIAATAESAAVVEGKLSQEAAAALAGRLADQHDASDLDVIALLQGFADEVDARHDADLLERRTVQLAHGQGAYGLQAVLDAVCDARAATLLLTREADPPLCSCPECGRLYAEPGACPLDGAAVEADPDGAEALVAAALATGADVWELVDPDGRDLEASGGLGAILRF